MFGWTPRMLVWVLQWDANRRAQRRTMTQDRNASSLFVIEMGFQQWR